MRKFLYISILSLLTAFSQVSCSDFLDEHLEDGFAAQTLFETAAGLETMVEAIYAYERSVVRASDSNTILGGVLYGERTTDLVCFFTGEDANLSCYMDPTTTSNINNLLYNPLWKSRYYLIARANEIIYYGDKLGDEADASVAEGSFWRAFNYFNLWVRFSRVYLNTEPVTQDNYDSMEYIPADSTDVFKLMYDDAQRAIDGLPYSRSTDETGRVFRATAQHLKALIAAWARDWEEVGRLVDEVDAELSDSGLSLVADPAEIFNRGDYYSAASTETLFALRFSSERGGGIGTDGTSGHRIGSQSCSIIADQVYAQPSSDDPYTTENMGKQWALALPNSYCLSRYDENDARRDAYYKTVYTYANPNYLITVPVAEELIEETTGQTYWSTSNRTGAPVTVAIGDQIVGRDIMAVGYTGLVPRALYPSSLKQLDIYEKPLDSDIQVSYKDVMIYRLAETYLLGAEAYMNIGNQAKAQYYYNKTWSRGMGTMETDPITFDMILDEHARELSFEGRRFEFLKRNDIWYEQMMNYSGDFTTAPDATLVGYDASTYGISDGRDPEFGPKAEFFKDFSAGATRDAIVRFNVKRMHKHWPVPLQQIQTMGSSFPQTEGY